MTAVTAHKHIMASINSRFDRDVDTIDANDAEESFVRIEPFSSDNLVSMRSSKRQGNGGTIGSLKVSGKPIQRDSIKIVSLKTPTRYSF